MIFKKIPKALGKATGYISKKTIQKSKQILSDLSDGYKEGRQKLSSNESTFTQSVEEHYIEMNRHKLADGQIKEEALYYYNMGFNISCITNIKNRYNSNSTNTYLKAPNHSWEKLSEERQTNNELGSYSWHLANGLGIITGFNNLITIDFDNCDYGLVQKTLKDFSLPSNYPWVVLSGSQKGYHIYIFVDGIKDKFLEEVVIKLALKEEYNNLADKVEILVRLHSILPPSLHPSGNQYKFINCLRPKNNPKHIDLSTLLIYMETYFDSEKQKNMKGYRERFSIKKLFNW